MRKKQKREFRKRITPVIGDILTTAINERGWTALEISEEAKILPPRISEIRAFESYGRSISEPDLRRLFKAGFLTVGVVNARHELSRAEIRYLKAVAL